MIPFILGTIAGFMVALFMCALGSAAKCGDCQLDQRRKQKLNERQVLEYLRTRQNEQTDARRLH